MNDKKLFLLDAYALIYRAYYALIRAPRITSKGFNTSAIFGFCNTLDEVLRKENPSHIAVCFDPPHGVTFRHDLFPEYKAKREAQPEDITLSVPYIKEIVEAYRIPVFEVRGFEADDVIGTLSRLASEQGFTTYMMTPDKDYGQLVSDSVLMLRPSLRGEGGEIRGPKEVCAKYGIERPEQVIDLLALEGDAIDNIPGCPGVGEKTAVKLISQYGSVENLLEHADEISGALGRKIRDNVRQIRLSYDLATIRRDVPMDVDFDLLRREPEDVGKLADIYRRLEFKSFLARLGASASTSAVSGKGSASTASEAPAQPSLFDFIEGEESAESAAGAAPASILSADNDYAEALTPAEVGEAVEAAVASGRVGVALYAVGAEAMSARLEAVAISGAEGRATMVRVPLDPARRKELMAILEPLFTSPAPLW